MIINPLHSNFSPTTTFSCLAKRVLEEVISQGVEEFCLCPGARNAPLVYPLMNCSKLRIYNWSEERSAAFFALGRIKATGKPVAVVTTSGTAAAEILPATMEAYYTGLPLVLMTADRPRRFRGSGAPQSAEQVGLFGCYVHEMLDLEEGENCCLDHWKQQGPLHLNVCFEEPNDQECQKIYLDDRPVVNIQSKVSKFNSDERYKTFLHQTKFPLVVIGSLSPSHVEEAIQFLLYLNAPIYAEGISGIREDPRIEHLLIRRIEKIWSFSSDNGYPIDGILRIGGVPTARFWRDLENLKEKMSICSISEQPFSGLSFADVIHTSLSSFFGLAQTITPSQVYPYLDWKNADRKAQKALQKLFEQEPLAEPSLIHELSKIIPKRSKIYLGNSLPIREWDQAATYQSRYYKMSCSRGVNGIDGQLSTFLGFSSSEQVNWSILGDLTLLYDLVAPWITHQLVDICANVLVINNGGAGIFSRMFAHQAFQNNHHLNFESLANFWNWQYERWNMIPSSVSFDKGCRLIELVPDIQATERFLKYLKEI